MIIKEIQNKKNEIIKSNNDMNSPSKKIQMINIVIQNI